MHFDGIEILQRGDPRLAVRCQPVGEVRTARFQEQAERLHRALAAFRRERGFGRAMAAPQIGIPLRFVAVQGEGRRLTLVDPVLDARSEETFTLWDDCLSFPDLLVRVRRHAAVTVRYTDGEDGRPRLWEANDRASAELLQHELDHLDGVLATDRAESPGDVVRRVDFERDRTAFIRRVDQPPHFGPATGPALRGDR